MLFLDTNVILRLLMSATSPDVARMKSQSRQLFDDLDRGSARATTSEVVLHEVGYVLTSKRHYGLKVPETVLLLRSVLNVPNLVFEGDEKALYLRALDIWEQHPKLEFSDSVIAARCERAGHELATFDSHFDAIPSLTLWQPAPDEPVPEASESSP